MKTSTKEGLQVTQVLRKLTEVLEIYGNGRPHRGRMAYCIPCESFTFASDYYSRHCGRDMSAEKKQPQCVKCDTTNFVYTSYQDLSELRKLYHQDSTILVVQGIEKALCNANSMMDTNLPVFNEWRAINNNEKLMQVAELFKRQDELLVALETSLVAQEKVNQLEKAL